MLDLELINRFSRQIVLRDIGLEGQERLRESTVAIIGVGGVGSPAALLLASMGVGKLILVDRDIVSLADLHRQFLYREEDIYLPKVEAAEKRLKEVNKDLEIKVYPEPIYNGNVDEIVGEADIILDGLDSMKARYILNRAIVRHRKPYIFAGAIEMYGNISTIIPYETPCLECFYHIEDEETLPTCATVGVHPSITSLTAAIEVVEATKYLVDGEPQLKNKLLYIDLRGMDIDKIDIYRDGECPVCGSKPRGRPKEVKIEEMELSCARDGSGIYFVNKVYGEVDLDRVRDDILRSGWSIRRVSRYSVTWDIDNVKGATLLRSGVLIGRSKRHSSYIPRYFLELHRSLTEEAIQTR